MRFERVCLEAFGYVLPPHVVTSAEIEARLAPVYQRLKLPEGRLEMMSGIKERRFWDPGMRPSETSALAGADALRKAGAEPGEIDCLLHTSVCRDYLEPASASFVHHSLKLSPDATVYDISNACLGFLNGMVSLANMIELGQVKRGLIVAGEGSRQLVESTIHSLSSAPDANRAAVKDAFASLTLGSGACALVMAHENVARSSHRLLGGAVKCATEFSDLCRGNMGGMSTDSERLLKEGCELAKRTWNRFTQALDWTDDSIRRVFCHQVGSAHRRLLFQTLGLDLNRDFSTYESLGNMGSVSLPATMAMGIEHAEPQPGDRIAMLGIGSGLNCLMLGVRW